MAQSIDRRTLHRDSAAQRYEIISRSVYDYVQQTGGDITSFQSDLQNYCEATDFKMSLRAKAVLARSIAAARQARGRHFPASLFAEPSWDMLLDLFCAYVEEKDISISSLCIASGAPSATALRHIANLEAAGLIRKRPDATDGRRYFVSLTSYAVDAMSDWLEQFEAARKVGREVESS